MKNLHVLLICLFAFSCQTQIEPDIEKPNMVDKVTELEFFDVGNSSNSQDIRVFFNGAESNDFILEYRIVLSPSGLGIIADEAVLLGPDFYTEVDRATAKAKLNLRKDMVDINGDKIANGTPYFVQILSVSSDPDVRHGITAPLGPFDLTDAELQDLYVSSQSTHSVQVYDGLTGEYMMDFVPSGSGGLENTQEIVFGPDGHLYVSGMGNSFIKKYDGQTGDFLGNFTSGYTLDGPTKMSFGPDGYLYVSQWGEKHSLVRFNGETGEYIDTVISQSYRIMGQAWDSEMNLYISSFGSKAVEVYGPDLTFTKKLVETSLQGPVNLWINERDKNVYVEDWRDGDIKVFDKDGNFVSTYVDGLRRLEGHTFRNGKIYVCDWERGQIMKFDSVSGNFIDQHSIYSRLDTPNSITFGPDIEF